MKTIQINEKSHKLLKEYCDSRGLFLGKFIQTLIEKNCKLPQDGRQLLVDHHIIGD